MVDRARENCLTRWSVRDGLSRRESDVAKLLFSLSYQDPEMRSYFRRLTSDWARGIGFLFRLGARDVFLRQSPAPTASCLVCIKMSFSAGERAGL
jgi:hypothetical protein